MHWIKSFAKGNKTEFRKAGFRVDVEKDHVNFGKLSLFVDDYKFILTKCQPHWRREFVLEIPDEAIHDILDIVSTVHNNCHVYEEAVNYWYRVIPEFSETFVPKLEAEDIDTYYVAADWLEENGHQSESDAVRFVINECFFPVRNKNYRAAWTFAKSDVEKFEKIKRPIVRSAVSWCRKFHETPLYPNLYQALMDVQRVVGV